VQINNAKKWRNMTEVLIFNKRTKLFWSWVNYMWFYLHSSQKNDKNIVTLWRLCAKNLFLVASPGGYYFIAAFQGCFNCTQLQIHASCQSSSQLLFWNVFLEILWANSVHIKAFAIICGCLWAISEYWEVKSISCWGCIVFRHCEGKDSR